MSSFVKLFKEPESGGVVGSSLSFAQRIAVENSQFSICKDEICYHIQSSEPLGVAQRVKLATILGAKEGGILVGGCCEQTEYLEMMKFGVRCAR